MSESLKRTATKGVIWSSVERFSVQGMQFVFMLVMARLLTPQDYGLIGMLSIFLAISQSLIDSGFSNALIRKQHRTEQDYSTVFYFNIVIGFSLYGVLFLMAPFVADFYAMPELTAVMRVVCLTLVINSLAVVQRAIFTVKVDFKTQAKASFVSALLSGILGVSLAYCGYGVWALAIQQLTSGGLNTLLLWWYSKWKPLWTFSWHSFHELFSFGSKLLLSGLLDTTYNNIYPIVIGKMFSAGELGHFTRAQHFSAFPSSNVTGVLQRVTYPVLCSIRNDAERLSGIYRKFLKLSAFIVFPLMVGLAGVSRSSVILLLGEQWIFCGDLLQIICFSMMWYPIHSINLNLLQVQGRSDLFLRLEIIKKIVGILILCITIPIGLEAMCWGMIVSSLIALFINTYYTGRLIAVGFFLQMRDLAPTLLLCILMFALVTAFQQLVGNLAFQLAGGILLGGSFYFGAAYLFRFQELEELVAIIRKRN